MPFTFNPKTSRITKQIAARIKDVSNNTRAGIRATVLRGFREKLDIRELSKIVIDSIGLTEPAAQAVMNYRSSLVEAGYDKPRISKLVEKYTSRKLKERATTISRTEVMTVINAGAKESWIQAGEAGDLILEDMERVWLISPGLACPICVPMAGATTEVDGDFELPLPAHPQCTCTTGIRRKQR